MKTDSSTFQKLNLSNIDWPETVKLQALTTDHSEGTFGILGKERHDGDTLRELVVVQQDHHRKVVCQYLSLGTITGVITGVNAVLAVTSDRSFGLGVAVGLSAFIYIQGKI